MSFVAWIDFDQADRERTRKIMDLFEIEGTHDEGYHLVNRQGGGGGGSAS